MTVRVVTKAGLPLFDELAPEVFLGGEASMRRAAQGEIRRAVIAARRKRVQVMNSRRWVSAQWVPFASR